MPAGPPPEKNPRKDVWDFLEDHFYQPLVLFASVFILAGIWLLALEKCPRGVVWGTIAADLLLLILVFIWYLVELEFVNIGCIVLAVLLVIGCIVCRKQIETSCVIMKVAMDGLFENKRLFVVTFGVQLVWIGYFALWVAGIIGMHFVKEVKVLSPQSGGFDCELSTGWTSNGVFQVYWVLQYYWVTAFFQNINTMMITANLAGWFFKEDDYTSFWVQALTWSVGVQAGGNAMCAGITGFLEYLLSKVSTPLKIVFAMLNPLEWIFLCIGLALKTVALTFTKFALIAMTIQGKTFCAAAPEALNILRDRLGQAVITDYIGKRVMAWCTYFLALAVAFAAWAWADSAQDIDILDKLGGAAGLTFLTLLFAIVISYPLMAIVFVALVEQFVSTIDWTGDRELWEIRAGMNSIFAAIFMGCVTQFLLDFISGIVVTAMDVLLFCIAVEDSNNKQDRFADLYKNMKEISPEFNKEAPQALLGQVVGNAAAA